MRDYEKCPIAAMVETKFLLNLSDEDIDVFLELMKKYKQQKIVFWVSNYKQRFFAPATSHIGIQHMLEIKEPLYLVCNQDIPKNIKDELKSFIIDGEIKSDDTFRMAARIYISLTDIISARELYCLLKELKGKVILEDDAETFRLNGKIFSAYEYVVKNEYDALDVAVCVENYVDDFFNKIKKFERVNKGNLNNFCATDAKIKNRLKL